MSVTINVMIGDNHPRDRVSRQAIRDRIAADLAAEAALAARTVGLSLKCAGECRPDGYGGPPRPWHESERGGCKNSGTTCICACHDQPTPAVVSAGQHETEEQP